MHAGNRRNLLIHYMTVITSMSEYDETKGYYRDSVVIHTVQNAHTTYPLIRGKKALYS